MTNYIEVINAINAESITTHFQQLSFIFLVLLIKNGFKKYALPVIDSTYLMELTYVNLTVM